MNISKSFELDYSTFNIFKLNEELKRLKVIQNQLVGTINWSQNQLKERNEIKSFYDEIYKTLNSDMLIQRNKKVKKEKLNELDTKFYKENLYYFNKKDELIEKINKFKTILLGNNKEKRKEKALADLICECGALTSKSQVSRHKKSPLHLKRLALCVEINKPMLSEVVEINTPILSEVINEKEAICEPEVNEELEPEEEYVDSESDEDEIKQKKADDIYFNTPLKEFYNEDEKNEDIREAGKDREDEFKQRHGIKWNVKIIYKKNIELRRQWNKPNEAMILLYQLDENGNETKQVIGLQ